MGKKTTSHPDGHKAINSPTVWFATLERARTTDNYDLAARASRELDRLGVRVRFFREDKNRRKAT